MAISATDQVLEGVTVEDGIGIENQDVLPGASIDSDIVSLGEAEILSILQDLYMWIGLVNEFD